MHLTPMPEPQSEKHFLVQEQLQTFIRLFVIEEPKTEISYKLLFIKNQNHLASIMLNINRKVKSVTSVVLSDKTYGVFPTKHYSLTFKKMCGTKGVQTI